MSARLSAETPMELPRWQEAQEGVQGAEQHDALLVHVGQLIIELGSSVTRRIAEIDGPPLEHHLAELAAILVRGPWTRVSRARESIRDVPALAALVDEHQSLILSEVRGI